MEKRCSLFRVICFIVFFGLISATQIIAAEANWKFFTYLPTNDPGVSLFRDFAADVLKSSNGRFEIKVFSAGELPYKPVDEIKITATNQVQLADVPVGFVAGDVPELNVFSLPFLCTTFDGFFKSIGVVAPIIEEDLMKRFKLSVLFHWTMPPQNLWTLDPVKKLEDIKGKKIRAWNPEQVKMLQLMGGSPVSIASDEVATSLQRRVIDGALTSALSVRDWRLYDYVKNGFILNFTMANNVILMNTDEFNKLPKDLQKLLSDKGRVWGENFKNLTIEREDKARKELQTKGVTLTEASPADFEKANRTMRPMWEEWAKKNGSVSQKLLDEVTKVLGK